jgi:hypothetical protein
MKATNNKACENREKEMTPRGVKLARGKCAGVDSIQISDEPFVPCLETVGRKGITWDSPDGRSRNRQMSRRMKITIKVNLRFKMKKRSKI